MDAAPTSSSPAAAAPQTRSSTLASATAPGGALAGLGSDKPKAMGRGPKSPAVGVGYALLSVFVPPLAVAIKSGDGCEVLINLAWMLLGYFPAGADSALRAAA